MAKIGLRPIVTKLNMPTVIKSTILPGDFKERLFIATQIGEIYYIGNRSIETFLDIRSRVLTLGSSGGGYDERGLLGLAFHPNFHNNGLFYLHYSIAGSQGPGASLDFEDAGQVQTFTVPDPCEPGTLSLQWNNRENRYDHIDTVEEWIFEMNSQPQKLRTLLNLRRPFLNHNGVNSLNFSPETGKLVLTTGDGGYGYDPFNLSQNDMEIAGKIIEIDVDQDTLIENPPVVTRFPELPTPIQQTFTVMAKGVRNIPGISFQRNGNQYAKYVGIVGQDLVESIFTFVSYKPVPVNELIQRSSTTAESEQEGLINFGWRGWEGCFPTPTIRNCQANQVSNEHIIAYYDDAVRTYGKRLPPLTCYFHQDPRTDKFNGTALTGVQPYMGNDIPDWKGGVVFTDIVRKSGQRPASPARGVLAYTKMRNDCQPNDFNVIKTDYDFGSQPAFYVSLGTNLDQTVLYLGVYGSMNVTDYYQGTVFEITP